MEKNTIRNTAPSVGRAVANSVQTKLKVGKPGDEYEQEADRVAEQVMGGNEGSIHLKPRRKDDEEEPVQMSAESAFRSEEEEKVQKDEIDNGFGRKIDHSWLAERIEATRGSGKPMQESDRNFMEERMGMDFSGVRVHTGEESSGMNNALNSRAFTSGKDIYFNAGYYQPETAAGKKLLAHELTHVVQQQGEAPSTPVIQGDFALEPPEHAEGDVFVRLTNTQVQSAIWYNTQRYNAANTRLIQDLVGTEQTGRWNEETVQAIAFMQWEYGLTADGKIGSDTFQHLNLEQEAEGMSTDTGDVLLLFKTPMGNVVPELKIVRATGQFLLQGHFTVEAQFQERANPADWEYRQSIKGTAWAQRPGFARANLNHFFVHIPGGSLPANFQEDGNTTWTGINYGHRDQQGRASNPINRYEDADGTPNQPGGSVYKGEDYPAVGDAALQTGDTIALELEFRGEIYRRDDNGRLQMVQRRTWTVNGTAVIP